VEFRKKQAVLRWNSKHMFETLESYNIHPRKTYDNNFFLPEVVPNNLIRHFIRGLFDGDGHKAKSEIKFIINSEKFLNQIAEFFKPFAHRINKVEGKTCIYYELYITGGKKLMSWINEQFYHNANYYLNRKYILFNPEVNSETKASESP